ncbi:MAG TPA: hypothetical protein VNO21_00150 [Polyangiaceae bacterium]|nr:hypothetical protein [Polyangiaceae bacterium]
MARGFLALFGIWLFLISLLFLSGCKKKVDAEQCDQLIDRYATLVVRERFPDAPAEQIQREQARERDEARGDENFRSCVSEVTMQEFDCAMKAPSAASIEKCLE